MAVTTQDRRSRRWGAAIAAIALVLVLVAGACGKGGGDNARGEVKTATPDELTQGYLAQVADTTTAAKTGRFEMSVTTSGSIRGRDVEQTLTGSGSYDVVAGVTQQSIEYALAGQDTTMEIITAGGTVYERSPSFDQLDPAVDGKWLKISIGDDTGSAGNANDPAAMLDLLKGSGATIEDAGTSTIDGVQVRHLRTTTSLKNLAGKVADERMKKVQSVMAGVPGADAAAKVLDLEYEMDVYVDGDNRVRRLELQGDLGALVPGADGELGMHQTVDYRDFGAPVTIEVPADEDTVDGLAVLKRLGGTGSSGGVTTTTGG